MGCEKKNDFLIKIILIKILFNTLFFIRNFFFHFGDIITIIFFYLYNVYTLL